MVQNHHLTSTSQAPGLTATAEALRTVNNNMLTSGSGDRGGTDNWVIAMTNGRSNVDEQNTVSEASNLKQNARLIVVGVGKPEDMNRYGFCLL